MARPKTNAAPAGVDRRHHKSEQSEKVMPKQRRETSPRPATERGDYSADSAATVMAVASVSARRLLIVVNLNQAQFSIGPEFEVG